MSKTIKPFMWAYQQYFRAAVNWRAKEVIQTVAPLVQPRALLIGIRTPENPDGQPVCVDPEDEEWSAALFSGCAERAEQIYRLQVARSIEEGDAPRLRDKPETIRKDAAREAVREIASAYDARHGTRTFCGQPGSLGGYHVVPLLQLHEDQILNYPRLPAAIRFNQWTSPQSLLDSLVGCLLEETTRELAGGKEPGRFLDTLLRDKTAILKDAAERLCAAIAYACHDVSFQNIFDALNVISSIPYEGLEATGSILFAAAGLDVTEAQVCLNAAVPIHEHRLARKMIEMSGHELSCICHGSGGISALGGLRDAGAEGVFRVTFTGHYKWELYHKDTLIMQSAFGVPQLPSVRLGEETFLSTARRVLSGIDEDAGQRLWSIAGAAIEQRHGTIIVISEAAAEEAARLRRQSIGIKPTELTPHLVRRLSNIDGALLVDPRGVCYAVGVILDGLATDEGDTSRGARYNSAVRYVASADAATICLIVSEDGYVDMMPVLRPQVYRSEVARRVRLLATQNIDNYLKTVTWLDEHRFYLDAEQAAAVNDEIARIRSAPQKLGEVRMEIYPFEAHPEMNESHYLPERFARPRPHLHLAKTG
jgi:hypothetical protein